MNPSAAALPPFTDSYLTQWTIAWAPNVIMAAATVGYLLLWSKRRRSDHRGVGALLAWFAAMTGLAVAFNSSISMYSDTLFWVHMIQHLLLIMVVPPFLVWADPWSLVPARGKDRTVADVLDDSRVWRVATSPIRTVPFYIVTVVLTHLTAFQQMAVTHPELRVVENLIYLTGGYVLFVPLLDARDGSVRVPDLIRFAILAAAMGGDTLTGVTLMMTGHPLAPAYAASHRGWGPGALADQNIAGALMWFGGDLIMMLLMILVAIQWGIRHPDTGLGDWLENIRRRQLLGEQWDANPEIDLDQAALDAYNARLAQLNRKPEGY